MMPPRHLAAILPVRIAAVIALVTLLGLGAAAQDTSSQKSRKERLEKEISILDRQLKDNAAKSASATSRLGLVQAKVRSRKALVESSDREISSLSRKIAAKQKEIDALEDQLDTMTFYYSKLVRNAYKNRDARKWYLYLLASDDIGQATRRYTFLKNLSKEMNSQAVRIMASRDSLEVEKTALVAMRQEAAVLRSERASEMSKLKSEENDIRKITLQLSREKSKYQKELSAKKQQAAALEKQIRDAIKKHSPTPSKPIDYTLASSFVANKGKLPWPVQGVVVSRFGKQYHPVFKSLQLPPNNGINLATAPDAPVTAVFDGVVAQITILPGYHQCILVQHGNNYTLYCKIKAVYVKSGEKVKTGQRLGTVDTIAGETVFHFELWNEKTTPQNPETWLRPLE